MLTGRYIRDSLLSGDVAALAGMPLEWLCVFSAAFSRPIRCWNGALTPSASFADGASGACARRDVSGTAVSGDVAALVSMPVEYLCVFGAFPALSAA